MARAVGGMAIDEQMRIELVHQRHEVTAFIRVKLDEVPVQVELLGVRADPHACLRTNLAWPIRFGHFVVAVSIVIGCDHQHHFVQPVGVGLQSEVADNLQQGFLAVTFATVNIPDNQRPKAFVFVTDLKVALRKNCCRHRLAFYGPAKFNAPNLGRQLVALCEKLFNLLAGTRRGELALLGNREKFWGHGWAVLCSDGQAIKSNQQNSEAPLPPAASQQVACTGKGGAGKVRDAALVRAGEWLGGLATAEHGNFLRKGRWLVGLSLRTMARERVRG